MIKNTFFPASANKKNVLKVTLGTPEELTPRTYAPESKITVDEIAPELIPGLHFKKTDIGCVIELPLEGDEQVYGLGLQLKGFGHKGTKKFLRTNSDPISNTGDSHAPVPFFVTTNGIGVYIDTARYATFYCGFVKKHPSGSKASEIKLTTDELYALKETEGTTSMSISIPAAGGADVYFFFGDTITETVSKYNRFSGGGCMPPLWGLGVLYRCCAKFDQAKVLEMVHYFRDNHIPCDTLGLEPGWQSHAYSSSYVWNNSLYPDPAALIAEFKENGFHLNLREQAFVDSSSPIYPELYPLSGDYQVWNGLVPDYSLEETQKIHSEYHKNYLIDSGVTGFKCDECDSSDYTGSWSFPDCAAFPSSLDGERMHNLFGTLYCKSIERSLGDIRTLSEIRQMSALCASHPFVLYSDLYGHEDFIRGLVNSGFSGILWSPEVRDAHSKYELLRRVQAVIFSTQALINAWYIDHTPWRDYDCEKEIRELFELRMSFIPYLYSAFYRYHTEGVAPIRALVSDFSDPEVRNIDDEFMFGSDVLVAPIAATKTSREVYLPRVEGGWYDFFTGAHLDGGAKYTYDTENIPLFVRAGTVLPLAKPVEYIEADTKFEFTVRRYGSADFRPFALIEDDGLTHSSAANAKVITLSADGSLPENFRYAVSEVCDII